MVLGHMKQNMYVLENIKQFDQEFKWTLPDGHYRIPDPEKYLKFHQSAEHGNCYISNWVSFTELLKTNPYVKLVLMNIIRPDGQEISHAVVLDGDIMIDKSQFRDIRILWDTYTEMNRVIEYTEFKKVHYEKALEGGKNQPCRIWLDMCHNEIYLNKGSVPIDKGSRQAAMESIIHL